MTGAKALKIFIVLNAALRAVLPSERPKLPSSKAVR